MNLLENIISQQVVQKLGWTLIHFLWEGTAAALLLAILLKLSRKSSANLRYIAACLTLGLMVLLPVVTFKLVPASVANLTAIEQERAGAISDSTGAIPMTEVPAVEIPATNEGLAIMQSVSWKDRVIKALEADLAYIVLSWVVGVFGLSIWHLGGWAQLQRFRQKMVKQVSERVRLRAGHLAEQMGVKRAVATMESALVQVPTVVGWLKPVILLPASALTGLSGQQIEAILAHELAHIKRLDYLVNMLQTVVEILGFYHPAVWWVSHKIRAERENCCDDLAVSISGDRVCYAKALTTMEEIRAGQPALAIAASGGSLFDRIRRLIGKDYATKEKPSWLPSVIAILLIVALVIPTALALSDGAGHKLDNQESYRIRHFVRLIVGRDKITFQGKETSWDQLPNLLKQVSHRNITVLEVGFTRFFKRAKDVSTNKWLNKQAVWRKAIQLCERFGFEYLSFVGKHKLGTVSGGTRNYLVRPMEFGKEIRTNLPSAEDKPLVYLSTIEFSKGKAVIRGKVTSYPKTKWDIEIAFFDQKMRRLDYVFKKYENSGIIKGVAVNHKEIIEVNIRKIKNLKKAKFFELSIKQTENRGRHTLNSKKIVDIKHVDVDIKPVDFDIRFDSKRGVCNLVVSIQNDSKVAIPKFKLRFYRGDAANNLDEAGNIHRGWHEAGPIEPRKRWNERTRDFHLPDGQYEFQVVLDYDDNVPDVNEANNRAVLQVKISRGKIVEKSVSYPSRLKDPKPTGQFEKVELPPTSHIDAEGRIVDKTDYPFVNDPVVIGTWKAIDYVDEIKQFKVDEKRWKFGDLFLNEMIFEENGRLISKNDKVKKGYHGTWTKGLVIYDKDTKTASKYTIKEIDGSAYMFYEWKSGDYTFRHRKPNYYVLRKAENVTTERPDVQVEEVTGEKKKSVNKSQNDIRREKLIEVRSNPQIIHKAAYNLFEKIKNADYDYFLSVDWGQFPIVEYYNSYRDYPELVRWICKTFKENPIVSIELGDVSFSEGWPRIYYKLILKDGAILEGDLHFEYHFYHSDEGRWHGIHGHFYDGPETPYKTHGLDWHLQDEPIKKPAVQVAENDSAANAAFYTSVITSKLNDTGSGTNCFIDFDKDELYSTPEGFYSWSSSEQQKWMIENGIDVAAETTEGQEGLWGEQIFVLSLPNEAFDRDTPATLLRGLEKAKPATLAVMTAIGDLPRTYLFKTHQGGAGLLQILEVQREQKPHYLKIRYKMVPRTTESNLKITSAQILQDLGKAMVVYETEHDGRLPEYIDDFAPYLQGAKDLQWFKQNAVYLGKGITRQDRPDIIIAYDKSLLETTEGTNVLYHDAHVSFEKAEWLEEQGIVGSQQKLDVQVEPIKKAVAQVDGETNSPQILTSGYILSVPADLPQLKEILPSKDKSDSGTPMITPEKLEEFLKVIKTTPGARRISTPKLLTNDGEVGEIRTKNAEGFESIKINIKNTVQPDRKTITLDLYFEYLINDSAGKQTTSVTTKATLFSGHAIGIVGGTLNNDRKVLLLIKPQVLERPPSKTGVVAACKLKADKLKSENTEKPSDVAPSGLVTQTYDVGNLLKRLSGARNRIGRLSGRFDKNDVDMNKLITKEAEDTKQCLIQRITNTIEPDSWEKAGGEGTIKVQENDELTVLQTSENQKKIQELLEDLTLSPQILIESRFLLVQADSNEIKNFFESEKTAFPINQEDPNYTSILNDEQAAKLLKLAQADPNSKLLAAPKVKVLDGEEASFQIQRTIRYGHADANSTSGQPEPKKLNVGTLIQVKPTLQNQGISLGLGRYKLSSSSEATRILWQYNFTSTPILLEVEFEYKNFLGFENDLPQTEIARGKARVKVPNGQTLVLGGHKMTDNQDGRKVKRTLLCLVKAEKVETENTDKD